RRDHFPRVGGRTECVGAPPRTGSARDVRATWRTPWHERLPIRRSLIHRCDRPRLKRSQPLNPNRQNGTMPSKPVSSRHHLNRALQPDSDGRATRIRLLNFSAAPMRAFHLSWIGFFLSFVAWFGIAPLMAIVREDLKLTKAQIGNTVIASVAITI